MVFIRWFFINWEKNYRATSTLLNDDTCVKVLIRNTWFKTKNTESTEIWIIFERNCEKLQTYVKQNYGHKRIMLSIQFRRFFKSYVRRTISYSAGSRPPVYLKFGEKGKQVIMSRLAPMMITQSVFLLRIVYDQRLMSASYLVLKLWQVLYIRDLNRSPAITEKKLFCFWTIVWE